MYLQKNDGRFVLSASQPWIIDSVCEDVDALFLDVDNDRDMDLYVVSGGNEYGDGSPEYKDRLYINDGNGNFQKANNALPEMLSSKKSNCCR